MNKGNIVFAYSGNKQVAVNMDSFVNATYRHRRTDEALLLNMGDVGSFKRQTTLNMPEAREAFIELKKAAAEPGSQLVYIDGEEAENVINLGKVICAIYSPDDPMEKYDLWLELIGYSVLLAGPEAHKVWGCMQEYSIAEKV